MRFGLALTTALLLWVDTEAEPLRVMSFNLKADFSFGAPSGEPNAWIPTTGTPRRDLATATIREDGPDLLGVQEAFANQVADLDSALTGFEHYGVGRNNGATFGEHSAIYYRTDRFTRLDQGTFWLSLTPDRPSIYPGADTYRIASWSILRDAANDDRELLVLNTHWATGFDGTAAREHSAQLVRDRLDALAGDRPVIVMGDLNAFDFQPAFQNLLGADDPDGRQLLDSYREVFPEKGPSERTAHGYLGQPDGQRIDYVLHSGEFRTSEAAIDRTSFDGRWPSDHYPVTATLVDALPGDFNRDGAVDAADYTRWRDGLASPIGPTGYRVWADNYGARDIVVAFGSVPEPATAAACVVALCFASIGWRAVDGADRSR